MTMTKEELSATLNHLVEAAKNSEKTYRTAAEDVRFAEYNVLFKSYAQQRGSFVRTLQEKVRLLGGDPEQSGTTSGKLHRGWIELKSIATGQDEGAILNEIALSEEATLETYDDILQKKDLPDDLRSVLSEQQRHIREVYDRVKALQKEYPYPDKLP
jgi:uncharacterized protein (TIGR02284 family)